MREQPVVLVVDDQAPNRKLLADLLASKRLRRRDSRIRRGGAREAPGREAGPRAAGRRSCPA